MIKITNLHKFYNKGRKNEQHVLNDINLELGNTGLVCILGESGSGKTTLLNTIGGIDTFSGGVIDIDGKTIKNYNPKIMEPIRNDHFDYVFQNYYLLQDYTVAYNIRLALNRYDISEEEKEERIDYVLDVLGISKYKKKQVSKLSGGQKQRVSIARALVKSPDVIFADEPTGNLDEENTLRTMSILKNISKECLVLLVTHEKRIAHFFADRIIEICDGKVVRDEKNIPLDSYERSDDSNIYLKEMNSSSLESDMGQFHMFFPKNEEPKKIELTLAWKDDKLYIQNNMPYNILIEGVENGVEIRDEERPHINLEDVANFDYHLSKMKSKGKSRLPLREIWHMAMENIRMMGKKQAFVIGILLVTAVLLSITTAQFADSRITDDTRIRGTDSHYVNLDFTKSNLRLSYEDMDAINNYVTKDLSSGKYGDMAFLPSVSIYLVGSGYKQLPKLTQMIEKYSFVTKEHLDKSKLIYGKMPEKRSEVVIDKELLERAQNSNGAVSMLHDSLESYLGCKIKIGSYDIQLTIVGISDTKEPDIFGSQTLLLGLNAAKGISLATVSELEAEGLKGYTDVKLKDNEILLRKGFMESADLKVGDQYGIGLEYIDDSGDSTNSNSYTIAGTFPDDVDYSYVLTDKGAQTALNSMVVENKTCRLYTDNPAETVKQLKALGKGAMVGFEMTLSIPSETEIKEYKEQHSVDMDAKQLITLVIMLISMIMVYFTIKSNAVSRSEELTVYRLIGISRGSILKAYMLEMVLMTSYTSLPAVLVTSGVIKFISSIPSLQISMNFPWWSILLLLVCIYAVHIFISIVPVYGILSKPPATLAVKE